MNTNILLMIREQLGVKVMRMYKYLKVPASTYISYETMLYEPNASIRQVYRDKLGINLTESIRKSRICYSDVSKWKAALRDPALHHTIKVYFYHTIQDMLYGEHLIMPDFKFLYPGTEVHSICVRVQEKFVVCRNTFMNTPGNSYLVVGKDGREEITNEFSRDDIYKAFVISREFSEEELNHLLFPGRK
jgi:hypothetical protein